METAKPFKFLSHEEFLKLSLEDRVLYIVRALDQAPAARDDAAARVANLKDQKK